jgi:hypothetical protein
MHFRCDRKENAHGILLALLSCALFAAALLAPAGEARAMILGPDDNGDQSAAAADDQVARLDGVGRIECLQPGGRGISHDSTGWVMGSADTVITAAHEFFPASSSDGDRSLILDPRACIFVLFNPDQSIRQVANIRYAISPWAEGRFRYDSSYDVAILKLEAPVKVKMIPAVRAPQTCPRSSVELLSFQTGVPQADRAHITRGAILPFPVRQLRGRRGESRITDASRLFSTSANSTAGSSGGMYYLGQWQAAIGLHIGVICDTSRPHVDFDPVDCFNFGLYFDGAILALVESVVADRPLARNMIATAAQDNLRLAVVTP